MRIYLRVISVLFSVVITASTVSAQANQGGDFEVRAGLGFGLYALTTNDYEDNTDAGVPGIISMGFTYQISNSFGIGIHYDRNGFLTDPDSNIKAVANNIGLGISYNFVNSEKDVFAVVLDLGASSFRYDDFRNEDYVISSGAQLKLGVDYRHYFNDYLGMFVNMKYTSFTYEKFENEDGDQLKVYRFSNFGLTVEERIFQLDMIGVNFGFGMLYKF